MTVEGNNNKRVDFGETFFLNLTVSNLGLADASDFMQKFHQHQTS